MMPSMAEWTKREEIVGIVSAPLRDWLEVVDVKCHDTTTGRIAADVTSLVKYSQACIDSQGLPGHNLLRKLEFIYYANWEVVRLPYLARSHRQDGYRYNF